MEQRKQYLFKEPTCQVESIIVEEGEEGAEEDILFVNVGHSSVASQTEAHYWDTLQPSIPGVPIFYCGQPSPGTATTQCFIPHLTHACVGTDAPATGSAHHQTTPPLNKPAVSLAAAHLRSGGGGGAVAANTLIRKRKVAAPDTVRTRVLAATTTTTAKAKTVTPSLPAPTHKKRGRKRKVVADTKEKKHPSLRLPSGKRRRRKKQDDDYEYDLGESEGETDRILRDEYSDEDEDWRTEKEQSDDSDKDEEEKESLKDIKLEWEVSRKLSPVPDIKDECGGEEAENNTLMDETAKYRESSEEYDDENDDGDANYDDEHDYKDNIDKNNRVLTVGIDYLDSENNSSRQQRKYSEKAKQKYHQEKVLKEDGRRMYRCLKCNKEFDLRIQLKEHRKVHAAKVRMYECSHCDKVFTEARKYYSHLGLHKQIFKCQECGRRFSLLGNLKKHLTTHEGAPDQVCEVCGHQFSTPDHLHRHHQTHHQNDSVREYKVECEHCGKKYVREEAYNQHVSGAPYKCSVCEVSVGCETKLKTHVRTQHGRSVCEFCGKSFKKNSLIHHIKIMHREACVPCPHCPKKFTYHSKMLAHLDANHSQEKKYKCSICGFMARTANTLNLHRRRRHQDPSLSPQYGCKLCTRKFYLPSKLALHYRVHTGEKPYSCQSCGKSFATKYNRAEHERCVHGERMLLQHPDGSSSVRVIKHRRAPRAPGRRCELCGLDLPSSWAMVTHMKQQHNAQTLPNAPLEDEMNTVVRHYEVNGEQCEAVVDSGEQDLLLAATPGVVNIPEYATHVEIDGVEYQVLRQ